MFVNVEKSLKRKRLVYNSSNWDHFFKRFIPAFLIVVIFIFGYGLLDTGIEKKKLDLIFFAILILALNIGIVLSFFFQDKLKTIQGKSRSNNVKLVREFAGQKGYALGDQTNESIYIKVTPLFFKDQHIRRLTILFDGNTMYYNCVTFDVGMHNNGFTLDYFRNPLLWFNNKYHERKFRKYIETSL